MGVRTALALALLAGPAGAFDLALPIDCTLGEGCHVQQAFDHDAGPGAADFLCGSLSYDGHDGTDFALPTLAEQATGVGVLAAADGIVAGARDGVEDRLQGTSGAPDVAGRECGNGVLLRHEGGWETQYCHMAQGSVAVAEGDAVAAGDVLGRVGLSGQTEFPHLHLTVRRDGAAVDPFAPDGAPTCGAELPEGMWEADVPLVPGGITDAGLATAVPEYEAVKAGTADAAPSHMEPLVLFALLFGARAGDVVHMAIEGPEGTVIDEEVPLERTQAQLFRAVGLRGPPGGWAAGTYEGRAALVRDGVEVDAMEVEAALP